VLTQDHVFHNTKHKLLLQEAQVLCCFYTSLLLIFFTQD